MTVAASGTTSSLSLAKSTTSTGYGAAGDTIPYTYTVTNTGTTTLHGVVVSDSATNGDSDTEPVTVDCPGGTVAPGASEVCHANYAVSQDDVDTGSVTNTAWASAVNPAGAAVCPLITSCPTQSVTVNENGSAETASLSMVKSTTSTFTAAGRRARLHLPGEEHRADLAHLDLGHRRQRPRERNQHRHHVVPATPVENLAPGASETCTGSYTTDASDVTNGSVVNDATATGYDLLTSTQWNSAVAVGDGHLYRPLTKAPIRRIR